MSDKHCTHRIFVSRSWFIHWISRNCIQYMHHLKAVRWSWKKVNQLVIAKSLAERTLSVCYSIFEKTSLKWGWRQSDFADWLLPPPIKLSGSSMYPPQFYETTVDNLGQSRVFGIVGRIQILSCEISTNMGVTDWLTYQGKPRIGHQWFHAALTRLPRPSGVDVSTTKSVQAGKAKIDSSNGLHRTFRHVFGWTVCAQWMIASYFHNTTTKLKAHRWRDSHYVGRYKRYHIARNNEHGKHNLYKTWLECRFVITCNLNISEWTLQKGCFNAKHER